MNRRFLLFIAALLAAIAVTLAVSGGFRTTVGGLRISARSPLPIAFLAFINFTLWLSWARRAQAIDSDLEAAWHRLTHRASVIAIALLVMAMTAVFATRSAAGADASGYVSQAEMWASGDLLYNERAIRYDPGEDQWLFSPLGWRPIALSDIISVRQAPTYPPGLPLLMAIPEAIAGVTGASALVVASTAIAVLAVALIASRLAGGAAAVIAAVLLGFTPVFLYQSIQPMSDVPVTAAWMVCFALLARSGASLDAPAGIACAIAVLIRPNLAPLAIVPLVIAQRRLWFAAPVAIAGIFLAAIQAFWYGSPFRSGYGTAEELFALTNIVPNASRYLSWTLASAPIMLFGVIGFWRLRRERIAQAMAVFAVLVVASYLIYAVFDDWSYLRFLLPALAVLAIFAAAEIAVWLAAWPVTIRVPVLFALLLGVTAYNLFTARMHGTFQLRDQLARVERIAGYINANVPGEAVILSGEQSGSMRYYTGRPILRWEAATPETLDKAVATLEQSGRPVFVVLDAWEDELFRKKFASYPAGALDWPPMVEAGRSHRTRLWKIADRDRFLRGAPLNITRLP
ncbi:MAG TPA: hypothetical protein VFZ31_00630 [Vicinamibacterales bacterium]